MFHTFQSRLILVICASVVPAAAATLGIVLYDYRTDVATLKKETVAVARFLVNVTDQRIRETQTGLLALGSSPALKPADLSVFYDQADRIGLALGLRNIALLDDTGRQVFNTLMPLGSPLPPLPVSSKLSAAASAGKPAVSDMFRGNISGINIILIGVPVTAMDGSRMQLVGVARTALFSELLLARQLPASWRASIFDDAGVIVARTHDAQRFVGQSARPALKERIRSVGEGVMEHGRTLDGKHVLTVFSRSQTTGWSVAIGIPVEEVTGSLRRSLAWLLGGFFVMTLISIVVATRFARGLAGAVEALTELALKLGRGEEVPRQRFKLLEVDHVAEALQSASHSTRAAAAALVQSADKLKAVLDAIKDAVILIDDRGALVFANPAAFHLFGYSHVEAASLTLNRLVAPAPGEIQGSLEAMLQSESDEPLLAQGIRRDGSRFAMQMTLSGRMDSPDGSRVAVMRDVSTRERLREALVRSNLDLQQYAFVASHDLRSPLRSVQGYLTILGQRHATDLSDKGRELLGRAVAAVEQMDALTGDLLSYARVGTEERALEDVDCNASVQSALVLLDHAIVERAATVRVHPLPTVVADRRQLVQLFQNLIGNALKYCERSPVIAIDAKPEGPDWIFSVSDNGIGIDPVHQQRIFEIFKRLHSQKTYAGTGIGLAICKRIVEQHGGRIWVQSTPGSGSTFFFSIPQSR